MRKMVSKEVEKLAEVVRTASDREMWTQMFCAPVTGYLANGNWTVEEKKRMDGHTIIAVAAHNADRGMDELNKRYPQ